jgi:asparagine synthase (glutamine-hydrolysing)
MCGIAGIFAYRSAAPPVQAAELNAITEHMRPRGPDAGATWLSDDARVGLGSRRLAIIDLSPEGTQPLWDSARELVIVFNGEIYNYRELRGSLERGGARFHTGTDTEVLLELYRRDGARMLGLLRGMFAFAIWDTRTRELFLARDPYGIKPLYIADDGATLRFASEVKALLAGGAVSRELDPAGAAGFFLTGSIPEPFTIRRDVRAMEPGTYFHAPSPPIRYFSIGETFRNARPEAPVFAGERLDESVAYHLVSDVPVGVFLSSGIDSSAIAAMAAKKVPLQTFTLAFEEFRGRHGDEAPLAQRFARDLGTKHTTRVVTREEFRGDLPKILERMDQPSIDGVNTWFISKAVHEAGVKVALSGLGGDELFGGYPSFRNVPRMVRLARFPLAARAVARLKRHPKAALLPAYGRTYAGAYFLQRGLFRPDELPPVAREGLERLAILDRINAAITPDPGTPIGRVASMEASLYMRNQLLRDADWASMAHSVEVRVPLVDAFLLRQLAPLLLQGRGKTELSEMLPNYLRFRPKTGFFVPMREWGDLPEDGTSTRMRSWALRVWEHFA